MLPRRIFCCCIAVVYSFAMIRSVSACTMGTLAVCLGSLVRWSSEHNSYLISYIATVRMHWYLYVRDIYLGQFCVSFHHLFHFTIIIFVFWCAALYHLKIIFSQYFFSTCFYDCISKWWKWLYYVLLFGSPTDTIQIYMRKTDARRRMRRENGKRSAFCVKYHLNIPL